MPTLAWQTVGRFIMQVRRAQEGVCPQPHHTLDSQWPSVPQASRMGSGLRPVDCCVLLLVHNHFDTGKY